MTTLREGRTAPEGLVRSALFSPFTGSKYTAGPALEANAGEPARDASDFRQWNGGRTGRVRHGKKFQGSSRIRKYCRKF